MSRCMARPALFSTRSARLPVLGEITLTSDHHYVVVGQKKAPLVVVDAPFVGGNGPNVIQPRPSDPMKRRYPKYLRIRESDSTRLASRANCALGLLWRVRLPGFEEHAWRCRDCARFSLFERPKVAIGGDRRLLPIAVTGSRCVCSNDIASATSRHPGTFGFRSRAGTKKSSRAEARAEVSGADHLGKPLTESHAKR